MRLSWKLRNLVEINYLLKTFRQFAPFLSSWLIELIYRLVLLHHIRKEDTEFCDILALSIPGTYHDGQT